MEVVVCCIAKLENKYLKEFVDYHLALGFSRICIYDNNDIDGERCSDVFVDQHYHGVVEIRQVLGLKFQQSHVYNDFYINDNFDWVAFIDVDEFISFTIDSGITDIRQYITDFVEKKGFDAVALNWMCFGDNGLTEYSEDMVRFRFFDPILPLDFNLFSRSKQKPINCHIKSIVKKGFDLRFVDNPHIPRGNYKVCNSLSDEILIEPVSDSFDHSICFIRHYITKSTEEYVKKRLTKGFADQRGEHNKVDYFFWNVPTLKKINKYNFYLDSVFKTSKDKKHHSLWTSNEKKTLLKYAIKWYCLKFFSVFRLNKKLLEIYEPNI